MIKFHKTHLRTIKKVEETTKKDHKLNYEADNIAISQKSAIESENQEEVVYCKTCRFANVAPCPNCSDQLIICKKRSNYFLLKSASSHACKEYEF
ncbi:MAG: hypothetical protein GF316_14915 [Candidatus Lokiarchaeota archaeon]|nr:hypothetical protein [Candidatus Lokiarchaeota archaeon]